MTERKKSILGRVIVITLFATVVVYFATAILGSVFSHLYGKPPPQGQATVMGTQERTWCIRRLVGLRDELEGQVTLELHHPKREGDPFSRWQLWNEGWRDKLGTAETRCVGFGTSNLDRAYERLTDLHAGYEAAITTMIRTRTQVGVSLQESLQQLKND
ncbi:MAG: hypothetical protein A2289_12290 [Deltaproteobacteria bacterium RIFOXYA12_FULL_58_15]|nr:MAG: hypothetical protein A2289_12290 [Deltaproteobacteria bacterium RIFOXYA12_FULL_58_15]OGR07377.1 MAG: hypothetical protein A2341_27035 [Deltaproteobacteria bacterium RIFOXYB12_FULL_58_9]